MSSCGMQPNSINSGLGTMFPAACQGCEEVRHRQQSPYRLVVRTSRCGRDNPGSTPGVVITISPLAQALLTQNIPEVFLFFCVLLRECNQ